jgi:hypothetical protein
MTRFCLNHIACLFIVLLCGCATKHENTQNDMALAAEDRELIRLECRSAIRLGCRHKGYIYPWNAWVEMKGYKSTEYEVKDVVKAENHASVLVMKR